VNARTLALTLFALVAFAANSLLCRAALLHGGIGPLRFTYERLSSGALTLLLLRWIVVGVHNRSFMLRPGAWPPIRRDLWSPLALAAYAIPFSLAYVKLGAGTGALLLFGAVQLTMIGVGLARGERPRPAEWAGMALALAGLVLLVLPGIAAPSPGAAALMVTAGAAWGVYSLRGRGETDPLARTGLNFLGATVLAFFVASSGEGPVRGWPPGAWLAIASGAITSGLGYVAWYAALRGLTRARAGIVQLAVPAVAALGGVAFLGERVSARLLVAAALILGGVGLAIAAHAALSARPAATADAANTGRAGT
jgi:drug/metabolite transporter (DMT)-like permease